jgi:hypothetical protein
LEIRLNKLAQVVAECWIEAESQLTKLIAKKHPKPQEELITDLLAGELRVAVARASDNKRIEHAFLDDLRSYIPHLSYRDAQQYGGLVASVAPHDKYHEGNVSAADLGIVVLRPQVSIGGFGSRTIQCARDHATGLLAQAKRGQRNKRDRYRWNEFTARQRNRYRKRRPYYSLLLYRLQGERVNVLDPVRWQLCHESNLREARKWLRLDLFPKEQTSPEILKMLFKGDIGTNDRKIIRSVIAPTEGDPRVIEIKVFWPDGSGPPPLFELEQERQQQEEVAYAYQ